MAASTTPAVVFGTQTNAIPLNYLDDDFNQLAAAINTLNNFSNYYADTSATPNSIAIAISTPQTFTLSAGLTLLVLIANTNTGATSMIINSAYGPISIVNQAQTALTAGQINAGQIVMMVFNGTNFQTIGI
jgi:hypothetical protein